MDTVLEYLDSLVEGFAYASAKQKLRGAAERTLRRSLRVVMWIVGLVAIVISIVSIAVFSYLFLYWLLVPKVQLSKPVFFNYDTASSRPEARVNLVNRQWAPANATRALYPSQGSLLARGIAYDVELAVRVPDSPRNREMGMLMAKLKLEACDGTLLAQSQRPVLIEYKGRVARALRQFALAVPLALGWTREESQLKITLIDGFQESSTFSACTAIVELSKPEFEVYESTMQFSAQLTGIRYAMYYWLFTSGVFGIGSILAAESIFVSSIFASFLYARLKNRQQQRNAAITATTRGNGEASPPSSARRREGEHSQHEGSTALATPPRNTESGRQAATEQLLDQGASEADLSGGDDLMSGDDFGMGRPVQPDEKVAEQDATTGDSLPAVSDESLRGSSSDDDANTPRAELRLRARGSGLSDGDEEQ